MTSQDTEALKALVAACEKEFCSPATEGGELVSADDESVMGPGECAITFGKIRAARAALERMLDSQTQEHTLWDHPQREVSPRPPVSPELDAQFKEIAQDMVLVPREPTPEMCLAAHNAPERGHPETASQSYADIWSAMLAAAPVVERIPALKALLGEQREAQGAHEVARQLEWFIGYAKSEDHGCDDLPNSRHCSICQQIGYAEKSLQEFYSAPPLAESVGDVEAAAKEIVELDTPGPCGDNYSELREEIAAIIRRHMQQGK